MKMIYYLYTFSGHGDCIIRDGTRAVWDEGAYPWWTPASVCVVYHLWPSCDVVLPHSTLAPSLANT